ncbi:MAG: DUF4367 domain-containing protein [Firmicutes bacterium]|nr:DUF4367 domain-containing protein [Bacillota bacterium]
MVNRADERFYKELAEAYAKRSGENLLNELAELKRENIQLRSPGLDRKIKNKVIGYRFFNYSKIALPLVASFLIAVLIYANFKETVPQSSSESMFIPTTPMIAVNPNKKSGFSSNTEQLRDTLENKIELISASLPTGYSVSGVDYDHGAAIMEIENEQNNRIILVTELYHEYVKEGFSALTVNDTTAYILVKNDYCLLKYAKDDMLYTLSGLYEYGDLIEIIENI